MFTFKAIMITSSLPLILGILSLTSAATDEKYAMDFAEYDDTKMDRVSTAKTSAPNQMDDDHVTSLAYPETVGTLVSYPTLTNNLVHSTSTVPINPDVVRKFDEVHPNSANYYDNEESLLTRDKRTLTFPDPSTILLIFGIGTPLQLDRESIIIGVFAKMIYNLPLNSTEFTEPGVYFARTKSRWSIYRTLVRAVEHYGFGSGKGCLLRAICDVADAPFDLRHGLFGQMAQAFLTPSSTIEPYDEYADQEYHAAEELGRNVNENCHALYPECDRSLLDVFSTALRTRTRTSEIATSDDDKSIDISA